MKIKLSTVLIIAAVIFVLWLIFKPSIVKVTTTTPPTNGGNTNTPGDTTGTADPGTSEGNGSETTARKRR